MKLVNGPDRHELLQFARELGITENIGAVVDHCKASSNPHECLRKYAASRGITPPPKPATAAELRIALPGASAEFILAQLEANATVSAATAAWGVSDQRAASCTAEQLAIVMGTAVEGLLRSPAGVSDSMLALLLAVRTFTQWLHQLTATAQALRMDLRWQVTLARAGRIAIPEQWRVRQTLKHADKFVQLGGAEVMELITGLQGDLQDADKLSTITKEIFVWGGILRTHDSFLRELVAEIK